MDKELDNILEKMDEITIVGYYGANNYGDDLMLESLLDQFKKYKFKKINILSYGDIKLMGNKTNINIVKRHSNNMKNLVNFKKLITNSQAVIWGGGTCFTDEDGDGFFKGMSLAKSLRKKIIYIGVGIGNQNKSISRMKTRFLLNISDYISFRDLNSYDRAKSISKNSFYLTEDPANHLLKNQSAKKVETNNLVIAWRNLEKYQDNTIGNNLDSLIDLIKSVKFKHNIDEIHIIDTDSSYDFDIDKEIFERLTVLFGDKVRHFDERSFISKLELLKEAKFIITSRLHVAVTAHYLDIECLVYNYSPKIKYYVDEIKNKKVRMIPQNFNEILLD